MQSSLDQAPVGRSLRLLAVMHQVLGQRLERMGLYRGCLLRREDEEVVLQPVRVAGPAGEVTLSAGMAAKVVVHHDDGHKTPIIEMRPGEAGHIEGLTSGTGLEQGLATLGLYEDGRVQLLRTIPPMRYSARLGAHQRLHFTESVAAKLWGELQGRSIQFANARRDHPFTVTAILGGRTARQQVEALGIHPGSVLVLEHITPADAVSGESDEGGERLVVTSEDGLRLYLGKDQAATVIVEQGDGDEAG
ncbi:MAG: ferrous iron transport protein A [Gammaproteobacteria bacterium]|jgi:Fe2+ transport system protein FeoA|nr:ferrous iron transport protein A [Gammaproteobacteria bacterium]